MTLSITDLQRHFIGVDTEYTLADGSRSRVHYLDSTASALMLRPAWETAGAFLRHYANTHSLLHFNARVSTQAYAWAHERALAFVGGDPARHACVFAGSGSTAVFNRLARALSASRPDRPLVLVTEMEHHSNDLPHRKHAIRVEHLPLAGAAPAFGALDMDALAQALERNRGQVRYVAVTGASNVTGILNPLRAIAELVHAHDSLLVVDASQMASHAPIRMDDGIDFLVFSGHKVYAPGSPGIMVARRDLLASLDPDEVGGGMVDDVSLAGYDASAGLPDREEAGTPNIVGAVLLGAALETLMRVGMHEVAAHERTQLVPLLEALRARPGVSVYGDTDLDRSPRTGTISFNVGELDHALVAAVLNDYFGVAVRNGCFCAHPYVREMLKPELWDFDADPEDPAALAALERRKGMARASLGLYTVQEDLDALLAGIDALLAAPDRFRSQYLLGDDGLYRHRQFSADATALFDPARELAARLAG